MRLARASEITVKDQEIKNMITMQRDAPTSERLQ
jgi:hypothetical protein